MQTDRVPVGLPGFDAAVAPWGKLALADFNGVRAIEIRPSVWRQAAVQDLHLHLAHWERRPTLRLHLCFRGVVEVSIRNTRQVSLSLYDVSARGWDDVFYEVTDGEAGWFSLACRDVDLLAVTVDLSPTDTVG